MRFTHDAWGKAVGSEKKMKVLTENIDELKIYKWACNWFMPSVAFWETVNTTLCLDDIFASECLGINWVTYYVLLIIFSLSLFLIFIFHIYLKKKITLSGRCQNLEKKSYNKICCLVIHFVIPLEIFFFSQSKLTAPYSENIHLWYFLWITLNPVLHFVTLAYFWCIKRGENLVSGQYISVMLLRRNNKCK